MHQLSTGTRRKVALAAALSAGCGGAKPAAAVAALAEDLVKFKWKDLAESAFDLVSTRVRAVERELGLPGSQVGYVLKASDALQGRALHRR